MPVGLFRILPLNCNYWIIMHSSEIIFFKTLPAKGGHDFEKYVVGARGIPWSHVLGVIGRITANLTSL